MLKIVCISISNLHPCIDLVELHNLVDETQPNEHLAKKREKKVNLRILMEDGSVNMTVALKYAATVHVKCELL